MVDGKFSTSMLFVALLVLPTVVAGTPQPAESFQTVTLGGQDLTDLAVDPSGTYAAAVVSYDATKLTLIGQPQKHDVYACDFTGAGCRGRNHGDADGSTGDAQVADAVAPAGVGARFAIGGPGTTVSLWSHTKDTPLWTKHINESRVVGVALSADAARLAAAGAPSVGTSGRVYVYATTGNGELKWSWSSVDSDGTPSRPTGLAHARSADLLAVGLSNTNGAAGGVAFLRTSAESTPATPAQAHVYDTSSEVREVLVSRDGRAALARTSSGIYYIPLEGGRPQFPGWNRELPNGVTAIALSADGSRFAAAAGTKIYFYSHLDTSAIALEVGSAYDVGASVADLHYDGSGQLLVAIAGNRVLGFGAARNTPIWNFDATIAANGGLDGPLRRVHVSDDAGRIAVGGKTKLMTYVTGTAAQLQLDGPSTRAITPGSTLTISFELKNTGSLPDNYTFRVTRPIGWSGDNPQQVALLPDQTATVSLTVGAPAGQRPGSAGVVVEALSKVRADRGQSPAIATSQVNLTVPRSVQLEVDIPEETIVLARGQEHSLAVTVRNRGNADGLVNLTAAQLVSAGTSWQIRFVEPQLLVPAEGEQSTRMLLTAPVTAASGDRNTITLRAREGNQEATRVVVAYLDPEFGVDVTSGLTELEFQPGKMRTFTVNVTNLGNTEDTFNLTAEVAPASVRSDWVVTVEPEQITLRRGATRLVTVTARPAVAEPSSASLVLEAVSLGSGETERGTLTIALTPAAPKEEDDDRLLPAPGFPVALLLVGLAALARRVRGGRR